MNYAKLITRYDVANSDSAIESNPHGDYVLFSEADDIYEEQKLEIENLKQILQDIRNLLP